MNRNVKVFYNTSSSTPFFHNSLPSFNSHTNSNIGMKHSRNMDIGIQDTRASHSLSKSRSTSSSHIQTSHSQPRSRSRSISKEQYHPPSKRPHIQQQQQQGIQPSAPTMTNPFLQVAHLLTQLQQQQQPNIPFMHNMQQQQQLPPHPPFPIMPSPGTSTSTPPPYMPPQQQQQQHLQPPYSMIPGQQHNMYAPQQGQQGQFPPSFVNNRSLAHSASFGNIPPPFNQPHPQLLAPPPHAAAQPPSIPRDEQSDELQKFNAVLGNLENQLADRPDVHGLIQQIRASLQVGTGDIHQAVTALTQALSTTAENTSAAATTTTSSTDPNAELLNPPPMAPTEDRTFSDKDLRNRDPYVIWVLYSKYKLQCKTCGLRFKTQASMTKHLDWHFKVNKLLNMRAGHTRSQGWLPTEDEWLEAKDVLFSDTKPIGIEDDSTHGKPQMAVKRRVAVDDSQKICPICHDTFQQVWDEELEEWMYNNAIRLTEEEVNKTEEKTVDEEHQKKKLSLYAQYKDQIIHSTCYESLMISNPTVKKTTASDDNEGNDDAEKTDSTTASASQSSDVPPLEKVKTES